MDNIIIYGQDISTGVISQLKSINNTLLINSSTTDTLSLCPVGAIMSFSGDTAPSGWLICNGATISRAYYSKLFSVINTKYGSGNGTTTFSIPDLRTRIPVGYNSSGTFNQLGKTGGEESHVLTANEIPAHTHYLFNSSQFNTSYTGLTNSQSVYNWGNFGASNIYNYAMQGVSTSTETASIGLSSSTGGGLSHNNLQPYIVLNYIIYSGTIQIYQDCYDGYIIGGWATTDPPNSTSGYQFTVSTAGTYIININASAITQTADIIPLDIWINGVKTLYTIKILMNDIIAHRTLVPLFFKTTLNAGVNYIYLRQTFGTSDYNDFASFNWIQSSNITGCYDGYMTGGWSNNMPPNSTSGIQFTVSNAGTYVINANSSSYTSSGAVMQIEIWINGDYTGYSLFSHANQINSHMLIVPVSFKYTLNQGTNYIYYRQVYGISDSNDFGSFNWILNTNAGCYDGYIYGGWPTIAPANSTTGTAFTVSTEGTYVINVNASAWVSSGYFMRLDIWINGINTTKTIIASTNEINSHKTLVQSSFKYALNQGTNYLYLQQINGTSDSADVASFNWVNAL